jgi:hypothetical protein
MPLCEGHACEGSTAVPRPTNGAMGSCNWDGYLEHGQTCNVICQDGYALSGEQPSCTGGVLTFSVICTPQDCNEVIELPTNSTLGSCSYNYTTGMMSMRHGEQCEFGCDDGFYLTGTQPACESGTLAHTVYCEGNPCDLAVPENGHLGNCPRTEPLRHGRVCEPACNSGYHRVGVSPSCNLGVLTSTAACEPDDCDETIIAPENGDLGSCVGPFSSLNHSLSCELRCNEGFEMVGDQPSCFAGTLTNSLVCRVPPEPEPEPEPEPPEPEPEPEPPPAPLWATNAHCGHSRCLDVASQRGIVADAEQAWWTECPEQPDCAGVCGGANTFDENEECCSLIDRDCRGFCTHAFFLDVCGVCDGPGEATWYRDVDGDEAGDPDVVISACTQPHGYVANADDDCDGVRDCAGICNGPTEFDCQSGGGETLSGVWGEPLCGGIDGEIRLIDSVGFCCLPFDPSMPANWRARQDCNGICGGTWQFDCAGTCGPRYPALHVEDDYGACCLPSEIDCSNECHGGRVVDCSGTCGGDDIMCIDCEGTLHGNATVDHCGMCDTDATNDCALDCLGVWGGSTEKDECNICSANSTNSTCLDCNGTALGNMYINECNSCVAPGTIEEQDCTIDCRGVWGGTAVLDDCGVCAGDGRLCMYNDVTTGITVSFAGPVDADRFEPALSDVIASGISADIDGPPFVNATSYLQSVVSSLGLPGNILDFDPSTEVGSLWRSVLFTQVRAALAVVLEVPIEFIEITGVIDDTPDDIVETVGRRVQEGQRHAATPAIEHVDGQHPRRRRLQGTNNTISVAYVARSDHDLSSNIKSRLLASLVSQEIATAGLASFSDVWQQLYDVPAGCEPFDSCGYRYLCENCIPLGSDDVGIRFPSISTNMTLAVAVQTGQAGEMATSIVGQLRDSEVVRATTRSAGCVSCVVTSLDVADADVDLPDCAGVLGGAALLDECGVCNGNSSCLDCAGVANGGYVVDMCGNCTARMAQCERDCSGVWGGASMYDACGVCGGDDSKCNTKRDCFGNWGGAHVVDSCGVCGGLNRSCADVCGVPYGDTTTCQGCDGVPLSGAVHDACTVCGGDNSTCSGCDGVPYSGLVLDVCGVCDGEEMCNIRGEALLFLMQVCTSPPGTMNGVLVCEDPGDDDAGDDQSTASWDEEIETPASPVYIISPVSHVDPGQEVARGIPRTETISTMDVFELSFKTDLAASLQVPVERVNIVSTTQLGRTYFVMDYEIKPDRSSDRSPTQLAGQVEAMRLAGTLHDQSWLFSHIQRRVVAPPPPPIASGPSPTPGSTPTPIVDVTADEPQSMLVQEDSTEGGQFGASIAVSMFTAIVGAPGRGSAHVFRKTFSLDGTISWEEEATLVAGLGGAAHDGFGATVAVANTAAGVVALVGAKGNSAQAGSAYVFTRSSGVWSQQAKLVAPLPAQSIGDGFGADVGMSGDVAVVGAHSAENAGAAYVFGLEDGNWAQVVMLVANDTMRGEGFGAAVAISSATIVVGAPNGSLGVGSAYVFGQIQGIWSEQDKLQPRDHAHGFGASVAISGDIVVVGAPGDENTPGAAYTYMRTDNGWTQHAKLTACAPSAADGFGISVAVSGLTAAIGSHARAAHTFVRNAGAWTGQVPLIRNDTDSFGRSVTLAGSILMAGAPLSDDGAGLVYLYSDSSDSQPRDCPDIIVDQPSPEPEPEQEPTFEPEPEPDDVDAWVAAGWPECPRECGPRAPVTRTVVCTVNDVLSSDDLCTGVKPTISRACETQAIGSTCDDGDEQTMGDVCASELANSCAGKVNLVAAMTYDLAFDATDVAAAVDENYDVDESPIAIEVKGKLATTLSASGMSCAEEDITIMSIVAGSLVIDYVVRVPAAVATPEIKAAAVAAVADPTTVGLPHGIMAIELSNADGDTVFASGAVQEAFKSYAFVVSSACPATPCPVLCGASALVVDDIYTCAEDGAVTNMTLCVASLGPVPASSTLCCGATDECSVVAAAAPPPEPEPEPRAEPLELEPDAAAANPTSEDGDFQGIAPEPRPDVDLGENFDIISGVIIPFIAVVGGIVVFGSLALLVRRRKKQRGDDVKELKLPKELTYDEFLKRMGLLDRKDALAGLLTEGRELVQLTDMDEEELEDTIIDDFEVDLDEDEKEKFREAVRELWADERDSDDEWDPVRVIWETVDTDGGGTLGREELREVLVQMGRSVTEEQLTATMEQVDRDGSGEVEFDEFERWWTTAGQHDIAVADDVKSAPVVHAQTVRKQEQNNQELDGDDDDDTQPKKKKKKKKKKKHRALANAAAMLAMGSGVPGSISGRQIDYFDEDNEGNDDGKPDPNRDAGYYNPSRSFTVNAYEVAGGESGSDSAGQEGVLLAGQADPPKKKKKRFNQAAAAVIAMRPPGPPPPPPSVQSFAAVQALLLQEDRDFTAPPASAAVETAAKKKKKKKKKGQEAQDD